MISAGKPVSTIHATPLGRLEIVVDAESLLSIRFVRPVGQAPRSRGGARSSILAATRQALDEYFAGRFARPELPFAWSRLPPFRRTVLETLWREVPAGETVTYAELAKLCGSPRAWRAVGTAMATNPWPIVVPCHRVLATGGIGGYGPGLAIKRALLAREGVPSELPRSLSNGRRRGRVVSFRSGSIGRNGSEFG